jgi:ATP-dependent helicase/nuclease subunit A
MPQLKVIRASAGSGKTFILANEYLRLLFEDSEYFMHILAVTFTNKATEEMKSRIVGELNLLAKDHPSKQLTHLMMSTGLNEKQIRNKATIILKKLLHQYSKFSVSTIDAFFQRIIRSFTRELGIQGGYSIELDTDTLLTELIERLLIKAETDKPLLLWLTRFAESLVEKGSNWNFKKSIRVLAKEIYREEFRSLPEKSQDKLSDRVLLREYQDELYAIQQKILREYAALGIRARIIIETNEFTLDNFAYKNQGVAGFLMKLADKEFKEPTLRVIEAAGNIDKWIAKNSQRRAEILRVVEKELLPLTQQALDYYKLNYRKYFTAVEILRNLYSLGILSDLLQLSSDWCNENNAFLLPEAPVFLNKIIDENDTPFIYEKAGSWYHHFMIDEFQDTSVMQWSNFRPLISNSMSQDFDNLIVGDVKQSIYRWRNSNWEILEKISNRDFAPGTVDCLTLDKNWRSCREIIEFNNAFFSIASMILQEEYNRNINERGYSDFQEQNKNLANLYAGIIQQPETENDHGGHVHLEFIEADKENNFYEKANQGLIKLLCKLQDNGYTLNDIAIMVRKNKEAALLADYLLTYSNENPASGYRFDVISDEALRLESSHLISFLISLLQYLINPNEPVNNYFLLSAWMNYFYTGSGKETWQIPAIDKTELISKLNQLLPEELKELAVSSSSLSLPDTIERIVIIFGLNNYSGEQLYLQTFRDIVTEYSRNYSADLPRFLDYWNETGKERSVSAPAGQDAIRILTIHKSKGLEFNIAVIPYCEWELNSFNKNMIWCKPQSYPFNRLEILPLNYSKNLRNTQFAAEYFEELRKQYIDNLNLLYVAFTRARKGLYIFCDAGKNNQLDNVSNLAFQVMINERSGSLETEEYIDLLNKYDRASESFDHGKLPFKTISDTIKTGEEFILSDVSLHTSLERIKIAFQGKLLLDHTRNQPARPVNEGKILHEIFATIYSSDDIDKAVHKQYIHGRISKAEKDKYIPMIKDLLNDIQVMSWFSGDWQVLTEAEIILPGSILKRPDRIITNNGYTVIIDYKFGLVREQEYECQVKEYTKLLLDMGYKNVEGYVWYVKLKEIKAIK